MTPMLDLYTSELDSFDTKKDIIWVNNLSKKVFFLPNDFTLNREYSGKIIFRKPCCRERRCSVSGLC